MGLIYGLRSKKRLFFGLLFLALIFNTSVRMILFPSSKEIIYDYSVTMLMCPVNKQCSFFGNISLANTGSQTINNLTISFNKLDAMLQSSITTLNLSSADPRTNNPNIKHTGTKLNQKIIINEFAPGTLLEIELTGRGIPNTYKTTLKNIPFSILADAKIFQGSPRGTKISRIFSFFLWL